jgi:hypothetical protein
MLSWHPGLTAATILYLPIVQSSPCVIYVHFHNHSKPQVPLVLQTTGAIGSWNQAKKREWTATEHDMQEARHDLLSC